MKITVEGKEVNVRVEDFEIVREEWNEYRTLTGERVRVKTTVLFIYRVLDGEGNPAVNPDGSPMIVTNTRNDIVSMVK